MMNSGSERSIRREGGFTLLEMLIAVTLVAMMAVSLWSVFAVSLRSWSRGTQFIDTNQRHRSILDMVRKQMASAYGLYGRLDQELAGNPRLIFIGSADFIRFISLNSLQFQESPGLTLVSYEVVRDSGGGYSMVEREARYLGQALDEEFSVAHGRAIPIFENLASCTFEYLDPGGGDGQSRWVTEWDGEKLGRLPGAVSMTMVSRDPKGNNLSRHMVVPIQAKPRDLRANIMNPFGGRIAVIQ